MPYTAEVIYTQQSFQKELYEILLQKILIKYKKYKPDVVIEEGDLLNNNDLKSLSEILNLKIEFGSKYDSACLCISDYIASIYRDLLLINDKTDKHSKFHIAKSYEFVQNKIRCETNYDSNEVNSRNKRML